MFVLCSHVPGDRSGFPAPYLLDFNMETVLFSVDKTMKLIMLLSWLKLKQRFLKSGHCNTFSEMFYLLTILTTSSQEAIAKALCLACQVTLGGLFSLFYSSPSPCLLTTTILTSTLFLKTWSLYVLLVLLELTV